MKVHRGKVHKYLGLSLDFSHKGQCCVTMYDYLDGILQAFDAAVKKHGDGFTPVTRQRFKTPAPNNLFVVNEDCDCEKLSKAVSADFHTIVAKTLYVTKFLTMRNRAPDTNDWEKLCHLMEYLRGGAIIIDLLFYVLTTMGC
jgi:hypothetical protein